MANPIKFSELFDIEGMSAALERLEQSEKQFSKQASADLNILQNSAAKLRLELEKLAQDFEQVNITTKAGQKELARLDEIANKTIKAFQNQNAAVEANKKLLESLKNETVKYRQEEQKLTAEVIKARNEKKLSQIEAQKLATQIQQLKNRTTEQAIATEQAAKNMKFAAGSYNEANERAKALLKSIKSVEGGFESTNPAIQLQIEEYRQLNAQLLKFEQQLGINYRNVGNYKSGFSGLSTSINQITRELPAFTNSLQTGFMGISNNIPMLVDEINKLKQANVELAASGQKPVSIFRTLTSALFSWQTLISVGITLLTVYGPKLFELAAGLFKSKEAFDAAKESIKLYTEAIKSTEVTKAVKDLLSLDQTFKQANKGVIDKKKALDQYNEMIGTVTGTVKTFEEAEKNLVRLGPAYIKMTLNKAAATAALDSAVQDTLKLEELKLEQERVNQEQSIKRAQYFNSKIDDLNKRFRRGGIKTQEEYDRQFNMIRETMNSKFMTTEQKRIQSEIDELQKSVDEKLKISQKFADESEKIAQKNGFTPKSTTPDVTEQVNLIKAQTSLELAENEKKFQLGLIAENKFIDNKLKITTTGIKKQMALYKEGTEEYIKLQTELTQEQANINKDRNKLLDDTIKAQTNLEIAELEKKYRDGKISETEFEIQKTEIVKTGINARMKLYNKESNDYAQLRAELIQTSADAIKKLSDIELKAHKEDNKNNEDKLQQQLNDELFAIDFQKNEKIRSGKLTQQEILNIELWALDEKLAILNRYKDANDKVGKEILNTQLERDETLVKKRKLMFQRLNAIAQEAKVFIDMLSQEYAIRQQIEFDNERGQLEAQYEYKKSLAGNNTQVLKQLDKEYQQSQRQLRIKEATAQKNMALFNIAINTASAIIGFLANPGGAAGTVLSILAGVQGAVQAGLVASRPIPQFYKGVQYSPEGPAIVGERGHEIIKDPSGEMRLTGDKPELTYLKKGSTVFTAGETKRMMQNMEIMNMTSTGHDLYKEQTIIVQQNQPKGLSKSDMQEVMDRSLSKLPINEFVIDESGFNIYERKGYSRTIKRNKTKL